MIQNKALIMETIKLRTTQGDPPLLFSIRNKASPPDNYGEFQPYSIEAINNFFKLETDGLKLKFRYTILILNARHNLN